METETCERCGGPLGDEPLFVVWRTLGGELRRLAFCGRDCERRFRLGVLGL